MTSDNLGGDHAKAWLAGVFDRAAPTYDRVGDAYHDYFVTAQKMATLKS